MIPTIPRTMDHTHDLASDFLYATIDGVRFTGTVCGYDLDQGWVAGYSDITLNDYTRKIVVRHRGSIVVTFYIDGQTIEGPA